MACLRRCCAWASIVSCAGFAESQRRVLSYCAGENGCNQATILHDEPAVDIVSTTSYYLSNADGVLHACDSSYADCSWNGSVGKFNRNIQDAANGSILAEPLIFNNAGKMMQAFHLMRERQTQAKNIAILQNESSRWNYKRIQFDLEPSCWADNASDCAWPSPDDAVAFASFLNDVKQGLPDVQIVVAAAGWWSTQCTDWTQFRNCNASSATLCAAGQLTVDQCNCCAYTTWFDANALCNVADVVVDMDTYQSAPMNLSSFQGALDWYLDRGCSGKLAVGLLSNQASSKAESQQVLSMVTEAGCTEVAFWDNLWSSSAYPLWQDALQSFLGVKSQALSV